MPVRQDTDEFGDRLIFGDNIRESLLIHSKNMTILSVAEAAKSAGVGKATIYRRLKDGTLTASKQPDGSKGVDTAELIRVFGELKPKPDENARELPLRHHEMVELLQRQIDSLENQLQASLERETKLLNLLEQRLLESSNKRRGKGKKGR